MTDESRLVDQHVGEFLTGFIDGELTQQQRQRTMLHCEQCEKCRQDLADLRALRVRIGQTHFSEVSEDKWGETMNDTVVQTSRSIGWWLFIAGFLVIAGVGLYELIVDTGLHLWIKVILVAIYGGLATLFFSVLRQRLIEHKTDKYKDVEI
jgi:hypothetical protein